MSSENKRQFPTQARMRELLTDAPEHRLIRISKLATGETLSDRYALPYEIDEEPK